MQSRLPYHLLAIATVVIWGITFVSTKVLIYAGLSPVEILFYRFVLAYVCLLIVSHKRIWADNLKDEGILFLMGVCGGSLYYMAENTALGLTLASNVSLLICTASVFAILLSRIFYKEPLRRGMIYGSLIALVGVALVVINGSLLLRIHPIGDVLTLIAAISWACYCLLLKRLGNRYPILFLTRKVFFYGVVSLLICYVFSPWEMNPGLLRLPVVYLNLLFLGIFASMLCYIMWNTAVRVLGASQTANYIYLIPLITLLTSAIFLAEPFTIVSLAGAICIIGGVYLAER